MLRNLAVILIAAGIVTFIVRVWPAAQVLPRIVMATTLALLVGFTPVITEIA